MRIERLGANLPALHVQNRGIGDQALALDCRYVGARLTSDTLTNQQFSDLNGLGSRPGLEPTISEYGEVTWARPDERGGHRQTGPAATAPHLDATYFVVQLRVREGAAGLLGNGGSLLYDLPFLAL